MRVSTRVVFVGVGRIVRSHFERRIVIVDFEEEPLSGELEAAEIMFAMRIVVGVERVERRGLADRHRAHVARKRADAGRHHHFAEIRIETFSKGVVELANAIASLVVNERHVLLHAIDASSWRAERRRGTLSIIILGVAIAAFFGRSERFVLFERGHKLGEFLRRKGETFIRWIGERSIFPSDGLSGFGCHTSIVA